MRFHRFLPGALLFTVLSTFAPRALAETTLLASLDPRKAASVPFVFERSTDNQWTVLGLETEGEALPLTAGPAHSRQDDLSALQAIPTTLSCRYADRLTTEALRRNLDPALIIAIAWQESRCRHYGIVSPKGAIGLMQVIPATGRRFGAADLADESQNIAAGLNYLRWLTDRYAGDTTRILAAYNAGEGAVDRHGGVPPYAETRAYVAAILGAVAPARSPGPEAPFVLTLGERTQGAAARLHPLSLDFNTARAHPTRMEWRDIITFEAGKRSGKPCIRGLRITAYDVLEYLAGGMTPEEIVRDFPELTNEDIRAVLAFAADRERRAAGVAAE